MVALFPGGTAGRKNSLVRWDVLLDAVEVWAAEMNHS